MGKNKQLMFSLISRDAAQYDIAYIGHFQSLFVPPKFCINIVSVFSWDLLWSQEKIKAVLKQNFGRQTWYF